MAEGPERDDRAKREGSVKLPCALAHEFSMGNVVRLFDCVLGMD